MKYFEQLTAAMLLQAGIYPYDEENPNIVLNVASWEHTNDTVDGLEVWRCLTEDEEVDDNASVFLIRRNFPGEGGYEYYIVFPGVDQETNEPAFIPYYIGFNTGDFTSGENIILTINKDELVEVNKEDIDDTASVETPEV